MFFGFLVGTLCLVGLARVVFGRRWRGGFHHPFRGGYGPGYGWGGPGYAYGTGYDALGPQGCDARPFGLWHRRGRFHEAILARLDATPAQGGAIFAALGELRETASELRGTVSEAQGDVARAVRAPVLDETSLAAAERRLAEAAERLRRAASASLGKIHGVLDDRQRAVLGDLIEHGVRGFCGSARREAAT